MTVYIVAMNVCECACVCMKETEITSTTTSTDRQTVTHQYNIFGDAVWTVWYLLFLSFFLSLSLSLSFLLIFWLHPFFVKSYNTHTHTNRCTHREQTFDHTQICFSETQTNEKKLLNTRLIWSVKFVQWICHLIVLLFVFFQWIIRWRV